MQRRSRPTAFAAGSAAVEQGDEDERHRAIVQGAGKRARDDGFAESQIGAQQDVGDRVRAFDQRRADHGHDHGELAHQWARTSATGTYTVYSL